MVTEPPTRMLDDPEESRMAVRSRTFVRPPTAQEAVLRELRRAIIHGEIPVGEPIPQGEIAARLGVSSVPVREALKILQGEGRVTYEPHRGYTVTRLERRQLLEIHRLRELLESYAVRLGISVDDPTDDSERLLAEMDRAVAAGDIVALAVANRDLQFLLFGRSGQGRLIKTIRQLWDWSEPYWVAYLRDEQNWAIVLRESRAVLKAFRRRDADGVVRLLDKQRDHALAAVLDHDM